MTSTNSSQESSQSDEDRRIQGKIVKKKQNERMITKIHQNYYDLTDFKHPGGPIPIGLIENRDGTELFESHHLFTQKRIRDILSAYEMKPAPIDTIKSNSTFNWEATKRSEFTQEL
jgi:cytochrome b involved in lipid metabolism